jgi:ribonuclease-3
VRATAPSGVGRNAESLLETERVVASVMEAAIGACYLHVGYEKTAAAVVEAFQPEVEQSLEGSVDFKSTLQELLARDGETVSYEVVSEEGPPHDRLFAVEARVAGRPIGAGSGRAKKDAEQEAAQAALTELEG